MAGQTSLAVDGGPKVVLNNLPDTGGWQDYQWSNSAKLTLTAGKHTLRWSNDKGGGYNLDALILTDDPAWRPGVVEAPAGRRRQAPRSRSSARTTRPARGCRSSSAGA